MNVLTGVLPPQARKILYALAVVVGLALTAWQAAEGDWLKAVSLLVASLIPLLAASNTAVTPPEPDVMHASETAYLPDDEVSGNSRSSDGGIPYWSDSLKPGYKPPSDPIG